MSTLSKFPRAALVGLGITLLAGGAFLNLRVGAAVEKPHIVFLRLTDGYWQLWIMDEDGRNSRQLTKSPVDKHSPSWCPGNEVVSFSTARGDNVLLELESGAEQPQLPFITGVEPPRDPDGHPLPFDVDVRQLLVERGFDQFARLKCGEDAQPPAEVVEVRAPNGLLEGKGIVVQRRFSSEIEPLYELKVADLSDRAGIEKLHSTAGSANARRVLSDEGVLAFVSDRSGGHEIWSSWGRDEPERVTDLAATVGDPFWSHDGNFLYFESDFEGTAQVYRVKADGEAIELVSDRAAPSRGAVLSLPVEKRPKP